MSFMGKGSHHGPPCELVAIAPSYSLMSLSLSYDSFIARYLVFACVEDTRNEYPLLLYVCQVQIRFFKIYITAVKKVEIKPT